MCLSTQQKHESSDNCDNGAPCAQNLNAMQWPCRNCGKSFGSDEAIRVRSNHGYLLPIHTCMLQRVEFWFDGATKSYLLVTPFNERPGEARLWWGCDDPSKMRDDACMEVYGREGACDREPCVVQ
jgi:hypothetical protein